ncbi:MAG TPA: DUF885 family protein [Gemmataceae bacterium]|jgi:hypothetical protein|nr:DUF885 family protein [Gemmataceae bacterium]
MLFRLLIATLFCFPSLTIAQDKPPAPKADAKTGPSKIVPKKDAKPYVPEVPDLYALVAKPLGEVRPLARAYEADQGALCRKYAMAMAPGDFARLRKFYSDWTAAVDKIDVASLSATGIEELDGLRQRVKKDAESLEDGWKKYMEVWALMPFAPTIALFEENRRTLEPFDPIKVAGQLAKMRKEIDDVQREVKDDKSGTVRTVFFTKARMERASEAVTSWRGTLKYWDVFYSGYDPMFTWWTAEPYRAADAALENYAKFLKDQAASRPTEDKSPPKIAPSPPGLTTPSDIPDPKSWLGKPSEMAGVIQRFQADLFGRGRLPGFNELSPAERRDRQTKLLEAWLAALAKIDFDKLMHTAQIDYLLVRTNLQRELDCQKEQVADGPRRPKKDNSDEIVGRPIGREALLSSLAAEMITYSPEQLVEMANREYAWCEAEMRKAAREMGCGDNWRAAVEKVKTLHVPAGGQTKLVRDLALEAIEYVKSKNLVTVPPLAAESWRMDMMSPERQRFSPFFTGGEIITVAYPTDTMTHDQKLQALRGNNIHFSRATVQHELIPGHHLQQFMTQRYQPQRQSFGTPFWTEGWAVYWEMVLYEKGFPRGPEDRVGMMFWRMHRCARVIFSLGFHLGKMTPQQCIDFLVEKVGHERENATAEVRRSFQGGYSPLYQAGYLIGAKQFWALRQELVASGKMTDKAFHDAILKEGILPVEMVRAAVTGQKLARDFKPSWRFLGELPDAEWSKR